LAGACLIVAADWAEHHGVIEFWHSCSKLISAAAKRFVPDG
jgi:hypothetical protein